MASTQIIRPADGGLDADSAPESVAVNRAPVLENFLIDRPGKLPLRGPINGGQVLYSDSPAEKPVGTWAHGNRLLVGLKANSATATRDPWVAPYRHAAGASELAQGHPTVHHMDLDSGAATTLTAAENQTPGPRHTRLGENIYGIAYGSATTSLQGGSVQRHTPLLRWDGTAALPVVCANGPLMAQDLHAHLNRLFVLGGMKSGTTTYKPNSLFWTDPGDPAADTAALWVDDISGLVNELVVDSEDPSDFGVALAKVGNMLVIFKRRSIHLLTGATPATFAIRTFSSEQGCIDPRSVVEYRDGVFFASEQGLMWFDGSQLINTMTDLRSTALAAASRASRIDGGRIVASKLPNDYIFVGIGTTPATADPSDMEFTGLYHPPRQAWVELTSDALTGRRPIDAGLAQTRTFLIDDQTVLRADALTAPEVADENTRGFDVAAPIFTFDESGGGPLFNGTGDTLTNQLTEVEAWLTQTESAIPARWHSRLYDLAQPANAAKLQRLGFNYTFAVDEAADGAALGWTVSLLDGRGNVLLAAAQVPAQGDSSSHAYRRQFSTECFAEANDAQLRVELLGTAQPLKDAAIFSSHIEFDPSHRRAGT